MARDLPRTAHFTFAHKSADHGPSMKRSIFLLATLLMALHSFSQDDAKSKAIIDQLIAKNKTYTSFDADETYTGLTESDLDRDPDRRYAATLNDNLDSEQYRGYLKWTAEPSDRLRWRA